VEKVTWFVPVGGGLPQLVVTSAIGAAIVPRDLPVRESEDGQMHVCLRGSPNDPFGDVSVICLFIPPPM
jgi:hypothetical protein